MTKNVETWLSEGKHLPEFMRDFHDQKDLFKTIDIRVQKPADSFVKPIDWISAQIYTVDTFLQFMGRRGYTLQKSRADVDFRDLEKDINETMNAEQNNFANIINGVFK